MTEPVVGVMRCPGCHQIVETAKYGEHMLKSSPMAHSDAGVIKTEPAMPMASTPYAVIGPEPAPRQHQKSDKHFLKRWADLWTRDAYGMLTFGFFMFILGIVVEYYR